jgi:transposase
MEGASEDRTKKRFRTKAERRRIVEETLQPGTSVARVARAHGTNANQVFAWRKLYREGLLNEEPSSPLLPVRVSDSVQKLRPASGRKPRLRKSGVIDIDLGHARVRIEGTADPDCVRAALEGLIR